MKKLFTKTIVLAFALTITAGAFGQAPSSTRQRRTAVETTQPAAADQSVASSPPATATPTPADNAQPGRDAAEAEIVQNYNNFFTSYKLGPEDVISVTVFGQDRYSRQGIKIPIRKDGNSRKRKGAGSGDEDAVSEDEAEGF